MITDLNALLKTLTKPGIRLGLEFIQEAFKKIAFQAFSCPVVTIAGTNGKGTTLACLEAIYTKAGYRVAGFTSPFIYCVSEQCRFQQQKISSEKYAQLLQETAEKILPLILSEFELCFLSACIWFKIQNPDLILLEVGLGGRSDAINSINPTVSVITSIDLDHQAILGNSREDIAREKAGILRKGQPFICGERNPPESLMKIAHELNVQMLKIGEDFDIRYCASNTGHCELRDLIKILCLFFASPRIKNNMAIPLQISTQFHMDNIACALAVWITLQEQLFVSDSALKAAITTLRVAARREIIHEKPLVILDVAHNPAAIKNLCVWIENFIFPFYFKNTATALSKLSKKIINKNVSMLSRSRVFIVFSMFADKDMRTAVALLKNSIDQWCCAPLQHPRYTPLETMQKIFSEEKIENVSWFSSIISAKQAVIKQLTPEDILLVCGSFQTAAEFGRME